VFAVNLKHAVKGALDARGTNPSERRREQQRWW